VNIQKEHTFLFDVNLDTIDHDKPVKVKKPYGLLGKEARLKQRKEDDDTLDILSENIFIESSSFNNFDVIFKQPSAKNICTIKPDYGSQKNLKNCIQQKTAPLFYKSKECSTLERVKIPTKTHLKVLTSIQSPKSIQSPPKKHLKKLRKTAFSTKPYLSPSNYQNLKF
jgi:hypothetical protein